MPCFPFVDLSTWELSVAPTGSKAPGQQKGEVLIAPIGLHSALAGPDLHWEECQLSENVHIVNHPVMYTPFYHGWCQGVD